MKTDHECEPNLLKARLALLPAQQPALTASLDSSAEARISRLNADEEKIIKK
jgi:hypothetical protein